LATLIFVSTCLAQQPQPSGGLQDPPWIKEFAHKRIVYSVPGMARVKVAKNLVYKRVAGEELKMDVYSPPGTARRVRRPAVVFIHGGRVPPNLLTTPKEWGAYVSFGELVAASGFVAVTFNHRFYTWNSLPDSQSDALDLIAHIRSNAASLGIDKDRIIVWTVSAGSLFLSHILRDAPPYIRSIVAYYPQLDLQDQRKAAPASVSDETLREFSPIYHLGKITKKLPPIFIAKAGLDDVALNSGIDRFVGLAFQKQLTFSQLDHPKGQHGFDIEDDNDRSREIIKATIDFIKAHH
jgi:acetyl esterase/lipase